MNAKYPKNQKASQAAAQKVTEKAVTKPVAKPAPAKKPEAQKPQPAAKIEENGIYLSQDAAEKFRMMFLEMADYFGGGKPQEVSEPEPEDEPEVESEEEIEPEPVKPAKPAPRATPKPKQLARKPEPAPEVNEEEAEEEAPCAFGPARLRTGPGMAYYYWDWEAEEMMPCTDLLTAIHYSPDGVDGVEFVPVWYENGRIDHRLSLSEARKYFPHRFPKC